MVHKYKFKNSFLFLLIIPLFFSCKTAEVVPAYSPQFTKVENLAKLKVGMSKSSVLSQLENVYPHEILNGTGNCEIHEYFYLKPQRSIKNITYILKREELNSGDPKYTDESKAYIVYRDKKLAVVYTDAGPEEIASLLSVQSEIKEQCTNENLVPKGCMDPLSLSYDPDALEDDGSCEYCDCGMAPNPEYNDKRPISDCNTRCIDEDLIDENGNIIRKIKDKEAKCDKCDLLDALKDSDATVNINVGSKKSNKRSLKVAQNNVSIEGVKIPKGYTKYLEKYKERQKLKEQKKTKKDKEPIVVDAKIIKVY